MIEKNCDTCLHKETSGYLEPCNSCEELINGEHTEWELSEDYQTCDYCKHDDKKPNEYPCNSCEHNYGDGKYFTIEGNDQNDAVNRPAHYTDGKIEVIEFIEDKKLGFCLGNAIKYIARAGKKNPDKTIEDINKAIWYLNRYIKELEEGLI